jgi:hypothetical protein
MCVHFALKQTAVVAVGRDTMIGEPSDSVAETAPPTAMSASLASGCPAAADADDEDEDEDDEEFSGELGLPEAQAARAAAPATVAPAARAPRRDMVWSVFISAATDSGREGFTAATLSIATEPELNRTAALVV